ncbi:hypothetical protein J6590_054105 [Homalodisca vitripennis]|nr:hypothetical protein J6590_054105 [Homalodisca vitripennis]
MVAFSIFNPGTVSIRKFYEAPQLFRYIFSQIDVGRPVLPANLPSTMAKCSSQDPGLSGSEEDNNILSYSGTDSYEPSSDEESVEDDYDKNEPKRRKITTVGHKASIVELLQSMDSPSSSLDTPNHLPSTSQQNSGSSQPNTGTSQQNPDKSQQKPRTSQQNPDTSQQNPGTSQQNPGTSQNPHTSQQNPQNSSTTQRDLGNSQQDTERRLQLPTIQKYLKCTISEVLHGLMERPVPEPPPLNNTRTTCKICPSKKRRMTTNHCL